MFLRIACCLLVGLKIVASHAVEPAKIYYFAPEEGVGVSAWLIDEKIRGANLLISATLHLFDGPLFEEWKHLLSEGCPNDLPQLQPYMEWASHRQKFLLDEQRYREFSGAQVPLLDTMVRETYDYLKTRTLLFLKLRDAIPKFKSSAERLQQISKFHTELIKNPSQFNLKAPAYFTAVEADLARDDRGFVFDFYDADFVLAKRSQRAVYSTVEEVQMGAVLKNLHDRFKQACMNDPKRLFKDLPEISPPALEVPPAIPRLVCRSSDILRQMQKQLHAETHFDWPKLERILGAEYFITVADLKSLPPPGAIREDYVASKAIFATVLRPKWESRTGALPVGSGSSPYEQAYRSLGRELLRCASTPDP